MRVNLTPQPTNKIGSWLSCFLAPDSIQPRISATFPAIKLILGGILRVVILVIFLCWIELACFHDLRLNSLAELLSDTSAGSLCNFFLLFIVGKDHRTLLVALVTELTIRLCWINVVQNKDANES